MASDAPQLLNDLDVSYSFNR